MIEIGNIVIQKAHEQGLSVAKLAVKVNITTQALYKLLHRKDQKISRLLQFSTILHHDFLQYYQPNHSSNPEELETLKQENQQLKQTLQTLQRENNLLHDMFQLLKSQANQV